GQARERPSGASRTLLRMMPVEEMHSRLAGAGNSKARGAARLAAMVELRMSNVESFSWRARVDAVVLPLQPMMLLWRTTWLPALAMMAEPSLLRIRDSRIWRWAQALASMATPAMSSMRTRSR